MKDTPAKAFEANTKGRDFVVGDIHGHFEKLTALLKAVTFDESKDRIFATGDLIDRGPMSEQVLNWLIQPWFNSVRGNHEQMAIDSFAGHGDPERHARNGGEWFYRCSQQKRKSIIKHLTSLPFAFNIELTNGSTAGIIHAEPPGWQDGLDWNTALMLLSSPVAEQREAAKNQALYARTRISTMDSRTLNGVDTLYVGHSTVIAPLTLANITYLDTGCSFSDGRLTIIDTLSKTTISVT